MVFVLAVWPVSPTAMGQVCLAERRRMTAPSIDDATVLAVAAAMMEAWGWPQWVYAGIFALSLFLNISLHGEDRPEDTVLVSQSRGEKVGKRDAVVRLRETTQPARIENE